MEQEAMTTVKVSENDNQERNSIDNILQLSDYLSIHRIHDHDIQFLDLDRCLRQPYVINDISNNQTIAGISLAYNYLIQMPIFICTYPNLIELNVSHNELNNVEFILYEPLNDDELNESYWKETIKIKSNDQLSKNCRANGQGKVVSMKNENDLKVSESFCSDRRR